MQSGGNMTNSHVQTLARLKNVHFHPTGHAGALAAEQLGHISAIWGAKWHNDLSISATQQLILYDVIQSS